MSAITDTVVQTLPLAGALTGAMFGHVWTRSRDRRSERADAFDRLVAAHLELVHCAEQVAESSLGVPLDPGLLRTQSTIAADSARISYEARFGGKDGVVNCFVDAAETLDIFEDLLQRIGRQQRVVSGTRDEAKQLASDLNFAVRKGVAEASAVLLMRAGDPRLRRYGRTARKKAQGFWHQRARELTSES